MVDKLATQLTSFICTETYNNAKDRGRIQYGLSILLGEGFKIIFLVLFFNIIHREKLFFFSLLVLMSTRVFAGGIHLKGALNCLLLTTAMFIFTSMIAPLIPQLPRTYYLFAGIASFLIVSLKAPMCSVRRPIKDKKKKLQYKIIAASSIAIWTIILLSLKNTAYVNCGFSTILLQSVQLVLIKKPKL
ncbi:accessory gene regulator B family protein [Clostridium tunisiense]|uniref:accessory gene regulator B family protein n=1 Tax=Clostridium tunisiense TaxID=219748 RepID=UPI00031EC3E0|nr:accessory gene regulator B family protein [Clostridium tunisiense]